MPFTTLKEKLPSWEVSICLPADVSVIKVTHHCYFMHPSDLQFPLEHITHVFSLVEWMIANTTNRIAFIHYYIYFNPHALYSSVRFVQLQLFLSYCFGSFKETAFSGYVPLMVVIASVFCYIYYIPILKVQGNFISILNISTYKTNDNAFMC